MWKNEHRLIEFSSDPRSAKYGQHYTQEQIAELFAPDESSITAVKEWLVKSGIPAGSISSPKSKGWLDFETTVGQLQSVLQTQYHHYDHAVKQGDHIGTDEYTLPEEISQHVDFVHPAVVFAKTSTKGSKTHDGSKPVETKAPGPRKIQPIPAQIVNQIKGQSCKSNSSLSLIPGVKHHPIPP